MAAEDIVITHIASTTHAVTREIARDEAAGFKAFLARVNAEGGVHRRKVVLENRDDHFAPDETVRLAKGDSSGFEVARAIRDNWLSEHGGIGAGC